MAARPLPVPRGYTLVEAGGPTLVARVAFAAELRALLLAGGGSLYEGAARHPQARALAGRGGHAVHALPLPGSRTRIVVRHNRHGGLLARITGDVFLRPTRAPHELAIALRLATRGVATPEVMGYAVYDATGPLARSDVATREIADALDLAALLTGGDAASRRAAWQATTRLLDALAAARAWHQDLNIKNVLLGEGRAWALDVDRVVWLSDPDDVARRNLRRLLRSAEKWRTRAGATVLPEEMGRLAAAAQARPPAASRRS